MALAETIQWVSPATERDLVQTYDRWADEYDVDQRRFHYQAPRFAVHAFTRHVRTDARILDAGAGTGLVGEVLSELSYSRLVAVDASGGMLEQARKKRVYGELHQMLLGKPLRFQRDSFDAVVSVGVLTEGHAPAGSLDELLRVTRPGGHVIFTLRTDLHENSEFGSRQRALEFAGVWTPVEVTKRFQPLPGGEPGLYHRVFVYKVA